VTLRGHKQQCGILDRVAADTRAGRSRRLVACGDPGIGRAGLGYATIPAPGHRAVPAEGVEAEMELPLPALHRAGGGMLDRLERPPDPQCKAPGMAFGLRWGSAPNRFLLGAAVLDLLSEVPVGRRRLRPSSSGAEIGSPCSSLWAE
jgi:hypothetical protein